MKTQFEYKEHQVVISDDPGFPGCLNCTVDGEEIGTPYEQVGDTEDFAKWHIDQKLIDMQSSRDCHDDISVNHERHERRP